MVESSSKALHEQLQRIYVLLDDGDRRALRGAGVSPTQYTLLRHLAASPSDALTISRLAEVLLCTRGNATRLVRRLVEHGLVCTRGDESDLRVVLVTLTGEGSRRLGIAERALDKTNQRRFGGLSEQERSTLHDLTQTVAEVLGKDLENATTVGWQY